MCVGVAIPADDLPLGLVDRHGLAGRLYDRGGPEVRFLWRHRPTLLPVWWNGALHVVRWGTAGRRGPLPPGGWTWEESVRGGKWADARAEPVDVPAVYLLAGVVWTRVSGGVRALLVPDPATGSPVAYVICRPATRYYRVMTRCEFQPVLIGEVI